MDIQADPGKDISYTVKIFSKQVLSISSLGPKHFSCDDPETTVHFKFDRFETEHYYDYLYIGYVSSQLWVLKLDRNQQTDIWVNADSIPDFNVYFDRKALTLNWLF